MENPESGVNLRGVHILIVQESPDEAESLRKILEGKGYRVSVALSGTAAVDLIEQTPPDLLVSDIIVPELDGTSLTKRIKREKSLENLQVILLTSPSRLDDLLEVLSCGADAFLPKPPDPAYLSTVIEYLRANRTMGRTPETVHTQFRVQHDGKEYTVAPGRRQLLDLLLSAYEILGIKEQEIQKLDDRLRSLAKDKEETEARLTTGMNTALAELREDIAGYRNTKERLAAALQEKERQYDALHTQLRAHEHQLKAKTHELGDTEHALATERSRLGFIEEKLNTVTGELEQKSAELINRNVEIGRLSSLVEEVTGAKKDLEEKLAAARKDIMSRETDLQKRIDDLAIDLTDLRAEHDAAQQALEEECARRSQLEDQLQQAKGDTERITDALRIQLEETQKGASNRIRELEAAAATLQDEVKRRTASETSLRAILSDRERSEEAIHIRVAELDALLKAKESLIEAGRLAVEAERRKYSDMEERLRVVERERHDTGDGFKAQAEQLQRQLDNRSGVLESVQKEPEKERAERIPAEERVSRIGQEGVGQVSAYARNSTEPGSETAPGTSPQSSSRETAGASVSADLQPEEPKIVPASSGQPVIVSSDVSPTATAQQALPGRPPARELILAGLKEQALTLTEPEKARQVIIAEAALLPVAPVQQTAERQPPSSQGPSRESTTLVRRDAAESPPEVKKNGPLNYAAEQWFAMAEWAHRTSQLSSQERGHLVIMGRLAKKGKEPNEKQLQVARELIERVKSLGYKSYE